MKKVRSRSKRVFSTRKPRSSRTFSLVAVFFIFALVLAPPIQHYFTQRAQINALRAQVDSDRAALEAARLELMRWQDPEYVKAQARERLHFVMPGERQYIVTGTPKGDGEVTTNKVADQLEDGSPWYTRMIASITQVTGEK
ncbi:MAG: FtsB family cell division protein [Candidatus Planktophila sp.]